MPPSLGCVSIGGGSINYHPYANTIHLSIHLSIIHPSSLLTGLPPFLSPSLPPSSIHPPSHHPSMSPFVHLSTRSLIHPPIRRSSPSSPVHSPAVLKPRKSKRPEIKSSVLAHTVGAPELPSCSNGASVLSCLSLVPLCVMGTVRVPAGLRAGRIVRGLEHCPY